MVQFTGDYSDIIQSTSSLKLPTASTETQYALWTVDGGDGTAYKDGDTVAISGNTTVTCMKYDKGSANSIPSETKNYTGSAQGLTGTVTWNTVSTVATGDTADAPTDYSLNYRVGSSGDWGEAITPGTYNVAITVKDSYYYNTQENVPISGTLTISKVDSSVSLTVDPTTSKVQEVVTLTATVTGTSGLATTGKVTFYKDGTQLGQADVSGDTATYTWTPDLAGTYNITAKYEGGDNYNASTSDAVSCTVSKGTLTADDFTVTGSGNVAYRGLGHSAQVTANVSGAGTITVQYKNDATNKILDTALVNIGTYSILISVSESDNFYALDQCDTGKDITITKGTPTMTVTSDKTMYTVNGALTLTDKWTLDAPSSVTISGTRTGTYHGGSTVITLTAVVEHAAGELEYTYQWYKGTAMLDGKTGETLELTDVADSGAYKVEVTAEDAGTL